MYKIGDRVIAIDKVGHKDVTGVKGTVIDVDTDDNTYLVEFDDSVKGHDGNWCARKKGKPGHCWWCGKDDISKIKETHKTVIKPTSVSCGMGLYLKISDKEVEVKTTDGRKGVAKSDKKDFDVLTLLKEAVDDALSYVELSAKEKRILMSMKDMGVHSIRKECLFYGILAICGFDSENVQKAVFMLTENSTSFVGLKENTDYNIHNILNRD
jgi:hypothetical protein